jgi:hypothetical protein
MGGGLMQLVAYGAQDIYLTGNPQITFFKVVYRRHTNFAMEAVEQTINGTVGSSGAKVTATIARNGDLLGRMWLELTTAATTHDNEGHAAIDFVELEIGGQLIDKQYGDWMEIWSQLTHDSASRTKLGRLLGSTGSYAYVPLQFWFCRNPGLALPLIALQYHEVKLSIQFATTAMAGGEATACKLWCDYIYLDTDERRRFAQVSHEYLIEQVQYNGQTTIAASTTANVELRFNHPVKELVWVHDASSTLTRGFDFSTAGAQHLSTAKLQLNGHDRMREREADYFRLVQPYQHHSGGHAQDGTTGGSEAGFIYCYSFALKPEEHQPSGTCNFSRIDNAVLNLTTSSSATSYARVYAVNYNVLRVMSGMGGLAYSN